MTEDEPQAGTRLNRLKALGRICAESTANKPLADVLENMVTQMVEMATVEHATITLLDDAREHFVVKHEYPTLQGESMVGREFKIQGRTSQEGLLAGQRIVANAPLETSTIFKETEESAKIIQHFKIKSLLIVPIQGTEQVLGTVSVDSTRGRVFSEADEEMYEMVAKHAAIAIENARKLDREKALRNEAERARELAEELGGHSELKDVAEKLLQELQRQFHFRTGSFQLLRGDRRTHLAAFGFDLARVHASHLRPLHHDRLVREAVNSREPRIVPDTRELPEGQWGDGLAPGAVNSWAIIPIIVDGKPRALVTLDHPEAGFFKHMQREPMRDLAQRVVKQFKLAEKFSAANKQNRVLALVNKISQQMGETLKTGDLVRMTIDAVKKELKCDSCAVLFLMADGDREELKPHPDVGEGGDYPTNPRYRDTGAPLGWVLANKRHLLSDDITNDRRFQANDEWGEHPLSLVAAPILADDRPIGVLVACGGGHGMFEDTDAQFVALLALQLGTCKLRNDRLALLQEVGKQIIGAESLGTVLQRIVQGAIRLTSVGSGVIHVLNENEREVVGTFSPEGSRHPAPRMDNPGSITRQVIRRKETQSYPDISQCLAINEEVRSRWKSMIAVPLLLEKERAYGFEKKVVGVLFLNDSKVRTFTHSETLLLEALASQAAIVIERTRAADLLREIVDEIPATVYRKDRECRFSFGNRQLYEEFDTDPIGRSDEDFFSPDRAKMYKAADQEVLRTGIPKEIIEPHTFPEGERRVKVRKKAVRNAKGEIVGVQGIYWDVTEAQRDHERYFSLVAQSPDAIVVHRDGKVTLANAAAATLFGADDKDDLIGKEVVSLIHPVDQDLVKERLEQLQKQEAVEMADLRIGDGDVRDATVVQVHSRPLADGEVQSVFHDVTRLRTLLQDMHHRTVRCLSTVDAYIGQLRSMHLRHGGSSETLQALGKLQVQVHAMAQAHWQVVEMQNESDLAMRPYLVELLEYLKGSYAPDERGIRWTVHAGDVKVDHKLASRVGAIVAELVTNSMIHARRKDAETHIEVKLEGVGQNRLELVVRDDGPGMSAERAKDSSRLGLSLVRSLAREVGGRLDCDYAHGVCWSIELPAQHTGGRWKSALS